MIGDRPGTTADGRRIHTLADVYPAADFVTYPSVFEGFGNAFLEAVYFGRPILVNNYSTYEVDIRPRGFRVVWLDGFISEEALALAGRLLDDPRRRPRGRLGTTSWRPATSRSRCSSATWRICCSTASASTHGLRGIRRWPADGLAIGLLTSRRHPSSAASRRAGPSRPPHGRRGLTVRMITGRGGRPDPRVQLARVPGGRAAPRGPGDPGRARCGNRSTGFGRLVEMLVEGPARGDGGLDVVIAHNACSLNVNIPLTAALRRLVDDRELRRWHLEPRRGGRLGPLSRPASPGRPVGPVPAAVAGTIAVTISEPRRRELAAATGMPEGGIRVVPNGIDRGRFLGLAPATLGLIEALDLLRRRPCCSRRPASCRARTCELAVRVVAELRRSGDDARLLLTGAPDAHSRTRAPISMRCGHSHGPAAEAGGPTGASTCLSMGGPPGVPRGSSRTCSGLPMPCSCRAARGLRAADPGGGRIPPARDLRGHPGAA